MDRATGQARAPGPPLLGWLLGVGEVALAATVVLHRSWTAGAALALFAVGLSAAGAIGVMSGGEAALRLLRQGRPGARLPHVLQLPLWMAVAWSVAREPRLLDSGTRLEQGLAMLGACAAFSAAFQVARMARAVYPMARQRRRRAAEPPSRWPPVRGASSW